MLKKVIIMLCVVVFMVLPVMAQNNNCGGNRIIELISWDKGNKVFKITIKEKKNG